LFWFFFSYPHFYKEKVAKEQGGEAAENNSIIQGNLNHAFQSGNDSSARFSDREAILLS